MNTLKSNFPTFVAWQNNDSLVHVPSLCDEHGHVILNHQFGDIAIKFLWFILVGYAFLGKGFAYIGFYPLYLSEMSLFLGLGAMITGQRMGASFRSPVMLFMVLWMLWGATRTLPYIDRYGMLALRDGVIWGYVLFTIFIYELMLAKPMRFVYFLQRYAWFALICPFGLLFAWSMILFFFEWIPKMSSLGGGDELRLIGIKQGDIFVHLAGAITFGSLFNKTVRSRGKAIFRRFERWMCSTAYRVGASLAIVVLASSGRGGLLAFVLSMTVYCTLIRKTVRVSVISFSLMIMLGFAAFSGISISSAGDGRPVSFDSVVEHASSIFGSEDTRLENTRQWRLNWWGKIYHYTFNGDYFFGKGFGVNIADSDGFQTMVAMKDKKIKLRSPHNVHMNVLARSGVPGITVWIIVHLSWMLGMGISFIKAKSKGYHLWAAFFLWVFVYVLAFHMNGSFDVFIEGPVGGVWFWSLMAIGLVGRKLMQRYPELLDQWSTGNPPAGIEQTSIKP